ncbi:MAG: hypothetical protein U0792_24915 [Gemmataceae bacterium]
MVADEFLPRFPFGGHERFCAIGVKNFQVRELIHEFWAKKNLIKHLPERVRPIAGMIEVVRGWWSFSAVGLNTRCRTITKARPHRIVEQREASSGFMPDYDPGKVSTHDRVECRGFDETAIKGVHVEVTCQHRAGVPNI